MDRYVLRAKKEYEDAIQELIDQGRYDDALDYLSGIENSVVDQVWVYYIRGAIYNRLDQPEMGIPWLLKADGLHPDNISILGEIAYALNISGQYHEALEYYCRIEDMGIDAMWLNCDMGFCFMKVGMFEEAVEYLRRAKAKDNTDIWVLMNLGYCLEGERNYVEARDIFFEVLSLDDEDAEAIKEVILLNEVLDDYTDQMIFIEHIKNNPEYLDFAYLHEAIYEKLLHHYGIAFQCLNRIENQDEMCLRELADTFYQVKEYEAARVYYEEARELNPKNVQIIKELVWVYEKLEDKEGVYQCLKEYDAYQGLDTWLCEQWIFYYLHDDVNLEKADYYLKEARKLDFDQDHLNALVIEHAAMSNQDFSEMMIQALHKNGYLGEYPAFDIEALEALPYDHIDRIYEFFEHKAYIETDKQGGFINDKGELVIDFTIDKDTTTREDTYVFHHGMCIVASSDKLGLIDYHGHMIKECIYDQVYLEENGFYLQNKEGTWIKDHDQEYFFNKQVGRYLDGMLVFQDENGLYGYMNINQEVLITPRFEKAYDFHEGIAMVVMHSAIGYIDNKGEYIVECQYEDGRDVSNQQMIVKSKGRYGVIDVHHHLIVPFEYEQIKQYEDNYYLCRDHLWGACDAQGSLLVPLMYDSILPFFEGLARVSMHDHYGCVNDKGELVIPFIYDYMTICKCGVIIVSIGYRYGYMDMKGNLLTPIMFSHATLPNIDDQLMNVSYQGKFYLIKLEDLWKKE